MQHVLYQKNQLSALIIGDIAKDDAFIALACKACKWLHVSIVASEIQKIVLESKIDLIFGTLTHQNTSYLKVLQALKVTHPNIEIVLFLTATEVDSLHDILSLKCSRYLYMNKDDNLVQYFKEGLDIISRRDIFLKDTQYFNALIDASIVSQTDKDGTIMYVNDNFTQVTGYRKEEILGKNHRLLKHPSNPPTMYQHLWKTITQGDVWRERMLNINKDGRDFWADTIIIPCKDERTGEIVQYLAIRRDITQMLEERRIAQAKELKANEQSKISEAKDAFLILFTHELKTPLNAIMNFSHYLYKNMHRIEEIPKDKRIHLLQQIYKSAATMLENVTDILDLSRLRNHKINYIYTLFNLKESILDVINRHEALACENKRKVIFQDDGSDPLLSSDEFRFKQIIANILSNAIKYSASLVEIFLFCNRQKIEIIIEDDGKGIREKESVFELYAQSSSGNTTMEKKGTGIGLNFVKLLCDDLGFSCIIEDSLSLGGAKFILTKESKG